MSTPEEHARMMEISKRQAQISQALWDAVPDWVTPTELELALVDMLATHMRRRMKTLKPVTQTSAHPTDSTPPTHR